MCLDVALSKKALAFTLTDSFIMMRMLLFAVCIGRIIQPSLGITFSRPEDLPQVSFDFVIIGGGTAGSVLANRLTENPETNVLVIEDGPSNEGVLDSQVPAFAFNLLNTAFDWNFTTTAQTNLGGRTLPYPTGHALGGSTSINGMFYTRGSSDDFNRFATITGEPSWAWKRIFPYILKSEKWTNPADRHNTIGQFNPLLHNFNGLTSVSLPGFPKVTDGRVIQTTKELAEFPFNLDMNSGRPLGLGWLQSTIGNGTRSSAATSYLATRFINRRNLYILLGTRVTRILPVENNLSLVPVLRTVEFAQDVKDIRNNVTASKEVILSAGAVGTPHILLSSGIGDQSELKDLGISPILHLPSVGKNLTDHPLLFIQWNANISDPLGNVLGNATLLAEALAQWMNTRTGPLVTLGINHIAWSRISPNSPIFSRFSDPSAGPNSPHLEITPFGGDGFVGANIAALTPVSRGSVRLRTNNPFDPPLIDPAFLNSEFDTFAVRETIKLSQRFFNAPVWNGIVLGPAGDFANATTDDLLDEFIRANVGTGAHPVGTAGMSAKQANYGVVNPDLLVKNISGLRIVDASIMPFITCGHTQAPVYAIAERAADLIKLAWSLS